MKFTLLILGSPAGSQSAATALRFARALLEQGHELIRVFFYHEAVSCANALCEEDADGSGGQWAALAQRHGTELVVCSASAARRGVVDPASARRRGLAAGSLRDGYVIGGLGELLEASLLSDRVVSFGP